MTELLPKFAELGISEKTLKALAKKGFEEPSPIQVDVIPLLLANEKDIIGQAETGTGKTAAFGIPLIERLKPSGHVQAIILTPTRELAIQVAEEINSLQSTKKLHVVSIYGGQSYDIQLRALKKGVDIVVGTPGRVIDHINRRTLKLEKISYMILDEADEMLNMGFVEDIKEIFKHTNPDKRVLLFSATMPKEILSVAKKYMGEYDLIAIKAKQMTTAQTEQIYFEVSNRDRFEALSRIVDIEENFYGIVFCKTKLDVDFVAGKLKDRGYSAQALHGDIQQRQREKILNGFKRKTTTILVATDVAARGIDVNDISHIINYSLPQDPESYIHRVGRTGRAGKTGIAITFVTATEYKRLVYFQRVTKTDIKKGEVPKVDNIIENKKKRFKENIEGIMAGDVYKKYNEFAKEILADHNPEDIIAALIKMSHDGEFDTEGYRNLDKVHIDTTGKSRLFIALGRSKGYSARSLVEFITQETEVASRDIDEVTVLEEFSFITVPFVEAEVIMQIFEKKRKSGGRSIISKAKSREEMAQRKGARSGGGSQRRSGGNYEKRPYGDRRSYGSKSGSGARRSGSRSCGGSYSNRRAESKPRRREYNPF